VSPATSDVGRLTSEVTERTGRLESPAEASAVLESLGYTDDSLRSMGLTNVFHAGVEVFQHQYEDEAAGEHRRTVERDRRELVLEERRPTSLRTFLPRFALKGFTFGAPMLLMLLSVLVLLYSLWASSTSTSPGAAPSPPGSSPPTWSPQASCRPSAAAA